MKQLGTTNRIVRLVIAAVIAVLYFTGTVTGTLAIVLLVIGSMLLLTGLVSFCPMAMMGICPGNWLKRATARKEA